MLDKVTRWVSCLPDNTTARSEGHVPFFPLQLCSTLFMLFFPWHVGGAWKKNALIEISF